MVSQSTLSPNRLRVVAKLEKRPNRAAALGRWIRALLSCHLGYLVSVPGLPDKLALLHQLIDRRVASFPKLLQLHGRLDLLLARAKAEGSRWELDYVWSVLFVLPNARSLPFSAIA